MLFWKEVYITWNLEQCNKIRDILADEKIATKVAIDSASNPGRSRGIPFIKQDAAHMYRILVKRRDYERAKGRVK